MSRCIYLFVCLSVVFGASRSIRGEDHYTLDPDHTSVTFAVSHAGFSYTYGRFNRVGGRFVIDKSNPDNCWFGIAIEASSIDTNNSKRDEHLRGDEFFGVSQFPKISFESTQIRKTPKGYDMVGQMTMHGTKREISIPLKHLGEGPGSGQYRTGFGAQFKVKRSDFGMKHMLGPIGDEVFIQMSFEGIRQ